LEGVNSSHEPKLTSTRDTRIDAMRYDQSVGSVDARECAQRGDLVSQVEAFLVWLRMQGVRRRREGPIGGVERRR
jgi:hypothetical protein